MHLRQSTIKERLFWWGGVPALALVLAGLAVLQYRWSDQVSAATRSEMQANLQRSLISFRQDLTRELTAVCGELRSAIDESGNVHPAEFSRRLYAWQQTAAHPALVTQVYLWREFDHGSLLRVDLSRGQMEAADWPAELDALRRRLDDMNGMSVMATGPDRQIARYRLGDSRSHSTHRPHHDHAPQPFVPWFIDQSVPALVHPLHEGTATKGKDLAVSWIIVQLNANALEKEVFPELVQRYFRNAAGLDYRVAILSPEKEHPLYSTDAGIAAHGEVTYDAAAYLFGPSRRPQPGPPAMGDQAFGVFRIVAPATGGGHLAQMYADEKRVVGLDRLIPLHHFGDDDWQIVVQHPRGSLEAAVSALRRRHLALSFGVLFLLAVTMAMVLIASQRAHRLATMQMNFVAGVSHELRTPLAVISSAAENIAHGVVADQVQVKRYGASILKQVRQLTRLVEQVLVFAATQQKAGNYPRRPVDVAEVIDAALEGTAQMASAAGIAVERRVDLGLPHVLADFAALAQCLQNLITNAIKYGGQGRWLGIRAEARSENGIVREVAISVRDKGIGISTAEIKHIFEPFYRSPSVASSNVHGTGLGLPLARTVIEAMRGRLSVESEPGKGSSFTIHLPAAIAKGQPEEATALDSVSGQTARTYP